MNNQMRKSIEKILPKTLRNVWRVYSKGRISEFAKDDNFLYDRNIIRQLHVDSYSQHGQDAFIYQMVFGGKTPQGGGFFLDVGGNEPITINNTYLLEQKGWTGIAFEPVKSQADKWSDVRKTPCLNIAIGDKEDEVEFTETGAHQHSGIGVAADATGAVTYKVKQRRLSDILKEHKIQHVDVVSIDVEGYERNVLEGIDFGETDITCFCIENNRDGEILPDGGLRRFMLEKGYRLVARLTIDDIFVKEDYFLADGRQ